MLSPTAQTQGSTDVRLGAGRARPPPAWSGRPARCTGRGTPPGAGSRRSRRSGRPARPRRRRRRRRRRAGHDSR
ncbi:hypothetical protein EKG83_20220 [Saccharothrix syringae]|uniref:Uncharacterized protein n=1 Tax=Saccharothrix syringae TaxID=103733 RepID=A0A5Q0GZL0_SACSY|nr:hypothetical protein EKG83_20220 [Saccharothrix syringae]